MTAEAVARVVADLNAGRVRHVLADDVVNAHALAAAKGAVVVDATPIYTSLVAKDEPVWVYEDHPNIAPPWANAAICYVNEHGNVIAMQAGAEEIPKGKRAELWGDTGTPVDWDRVRWKIDIFVWIGGSSPSTGALPTTGPVHMWRFAVHEDGSPADLRWVRLHPEYPLEHWDMAHLVMLGALNFCACRNVRLVEPEHPRPTRRRLARLGVKVHTINVFPVGKTYTGTARTGGGGGGVPLTSVRGHFAEYGVNGKGLLFGKHAGRFWVPQHARGSKEHGESRADYRLMPEPAGGSG